MEITVSEHQRNILLQIARRKVPQADAEDVVQDALVKTLRFHDPTRCELFGFARVCLLSVISDYWRKQRPEQLQEWDGPRFISMDGVWYDQLWRAIAQRDPALAELMDHRVLGGKNPGHGAMYSRRMGKLRALLIEMGVGRTSGHHQAKGITD